MSMPDDFAALLGVPRLSKRARFALKGAVLRNILPHAGKKTIRVMKLPHSDSRKLALCAERIIRDFGKAPHRIALECQPDGQDMLLRITTGERVAGDGAEQRVIRVLGDPDADRAKEHEFTLVEATEDGKAQTGRLVVWALSDEEARDWLWDDGYDECACGACTKWFLHKGSDEQLCALCSACVAVPD